jgi:hypothetical protein
MLLEMEKDLFAIFPDLPSPRRVRPPVRQVVSNVEPPLPRTTKVARRRIPIVNRATETLALRKIHQIDDEALRRIRKIAHAESERLNSNDHVAHVLRTIMAVADAATRAAANRSR